MRLDLSDLLNEIGSYSQIEKHAGIVCLTCNTGKAAGREVVMIISRQGENCQNSYESD